MLTQFDVCNFLKFIGMIFSTLKLTLYTIVFLSYCKSIQAQSVGQFLFSTNNNSISITDDSFLSWSLGEPIIGSQITSDLTLTQGFQQPVQDIQTSFIVPEFDGTITIYPNPVLNDLTISLGEEVNLTVYIVDLVGRQMTQSISLNQLTTVDLSELSSGLYHVSIKEKNTLIATIPIIKI